MQVSLLRWKFPWKSVEVDLLRNSMEIPMEVGGTVGLLPWKLVKASIEVHGSFRCRWKLNLPLLPSIAPSTNIFRGSFHELPHTPTYFYLTQIPQTSSFFHKTSIRVHRLPFDLLPYTFPSTSMEASMAVKLEVN